MATALCAVTAMTAAGCGGKNNGGSGHQFTVLAVKEEAVNSYNDMQVFKDIAEETGKDVYWTFNTSAQYNRNTNKAGIKGIDAIYHSGFSNLQLNDYGKRGRIVAIDEYLDSMPNFKKILDSRPDIREALKSPDGHIYSLPRVEEMGLKTYPNILFLNKKWVEKLIDGGNMPAGVSLTKADLADGLDISRDDFKAILQKFAELDMDGDGKTTNEVPLSFVSNNWQGNESDLIASFGIPENIQHKTILNGKITFTIEDEKWFNAIKELHDWYEKGIIRTASYDKGQDEFLANGHTGIYGSFYWWEKETVVNNADDYIIVKPLKDENGNRYVGPSNELEVEKAVCVIMGSCKDKAGLLSYFDKFYEPEYSAQLNYGSIAAGAYKYTEDADGKIIPERDEKGRIIPNTDHGNQSADDFRMRNAPYGLVYLTEDVFKNNVVMEPRAQLRQDRLAAYVTPYTYPGAKPIPNLNYTEAELNTLSQYEATLAKNITSYMTKAITGDSVPTKTKWQQDLVNKNKTSIEKVKKTNQDAYDRYLVEISK
ncbi:MAG: hypothetical protein K2N22_05385 [Clostridia bacterium]|nr:hypothetical protein [Clostridia bacterium]